MSNIHLRTLHLGSGIAGERDKLEQMVLDVPWKRINTLCICNLSKNKFKTETLTKKMLYFFKKAIKLLQHWGHCPQPPLATVDCGLCHTDTHMVLTLNGVARKNKWGHAPRGTGLGSASAYFCSHLKTCFKQKFRPKYA